MHAIRKDIIFFVPDDLTKGYKAVDVDRILNITKILQPVLTF